MDNNIKNKSNMLSIGDNAFDLLSLCAALDVALAHTVAHVLGGGYGATFKFWFLIAPGVSVVFFFTISGFLIAASLDRKSNLFHFALRRALRIYPGLWIAVLVPLGLYIITGLVKVKPTEIWTFLPVKLLSGISIHAFDTPNGGLGNGSLWTISVQIQFYALIGLCWKRIKRLKIKGWIVLLFICLLLSCFHESILQFNNLFAKFYDYLIVPYLYMFLIGVFFYLYRNKYILWLKQNWKLLLITFLIWHWSSELIGFDKMIPGEYINIVTGLFAGVLVIALGFGIGKIRFKHDISYSLYLWHMPVIDILRLVVGIENATIHFIASLFASILVSMLSCRLIEEPALKLKSTISI